MAADLSPIDAQLQAVVLQAHTHSFTVRSDYARSFAEYVAMAASLGLISTKIAGNLYSSHWRPTVKGLAWLNETMEDVDVD